MLFFPFLIRKAQNSVGESVDNQSKYILYRCTLLWRCKPVNLYTKPPYVLLFTAPQQPIQLSESSIADGSSVCVSMNTDWLLQAELLTHRGACTLFSTGSMFNHQAPTTMLVGLQSCTQAQLCSELKANVRMFTVTMVTCWCSTGIMFTVFIILI